MDMKKIPQKQIYEILAGLNGLAGVYVENIGTGEVFEVNPQQVFPCASVIKIPILALFLKDAEEKRLDLYAPRKLSRENLVGGTGIYRELDPYYEPSYYTLAKLMIVMSDNSATNEIIDSIGMERFREFCVEMGYPHTRLMRKMMDFQAIGEGRNNYMCAGEAGRIVSDVAKRRLISPEISETIEDMMNGQQHRNKLPALIPAIPSYASPEDHRNIRPGTVLVANKTGDLAGIQHDVGIFTLPDGSRYVIAVFTGGLERDCDGINAIAEISKAVYECLK